MPKQQTTSVPILFVEVIPVLVKEDDSCRYHSPLTNFGVKQFLLRETQVAATATITGTISKSQLFIRWKERNTSLTLSSGYIFQNDEYHRYKYSDDKESFPLTYIPSEDPTTIDYQPCCIIAYAYNDTNALRDVTDREEFIMCQFTRCTLVRILPPQLVVNLSFGTSLDLNMPSTYSSFHILRHNLMLSDLLGEEGRINTITEEMMEEVLQNHDPKTIDELQLKLSNTMQPVSIGTTYDAFRVRKERKQQLLNIKQSIKTFHSKLTMEGKTSNASAHCRERRAGLQLLWPSLIVHSPNHADGKTLLVQAIAKKRLGCSLIHLVRPCALLAKYGIHADLALESQLHATLVSAACRRQSICIVLDQLDSFMPAQMSGRSSFGDSAPPVLNAIASYLRQIATSLQRYQEWPFPTKNPLYNPTTYSSSCTSVFTLNVCLVGIVTCPDDGWRSFKSKMGSVGYSGSSILDCMGGDRYRVPLLQAKTILSAFYAAFSREGVALDISAERKLSTIVSSAAWAKGSIFSRVAKQLKENLLENCKYGDDFMRVATSNDLEEAISLVKRTTNKSAQMNDQPELKSRLENKQNSSCFASIGGNEQAKVSLEDALAFDPLKREILSRFGLSPPTGVLLYGPPGCGKTLLARAVSRILKSSNSGEPGGTFISLSISEIVSAEVGTSEKTIVSSFEFAEKNAPSVSFFMFL